MNRAAGVSLLLKKHHIPLRPCGDQDLIHGNIQQGAQRIQVIDRRQGLSVLPFVDRLRSFESEERLQIADAKTAVLPQTDDVLPGGDGIDHGENGLLHSVSPPFNRSPIWGVIQNIGNGSKVQAFSAYCNKIVT